MKTIEIVVLETGPDYLDKVEGFQMEVPGNKDQAIAKAIEAVKDRGYKVLLDDQGGCNEYVTIGNEKEYIAITVRCAEGGEEE